jgi:PleD family two-component response regulator
MTTRLQGGGFEVARANNGKQALQVLDDQWYPLVITDWQMPVMDGLAFTQALRARGIEDTYIIMLTTRDASADFERGYVSGVDDYLTKKVSDAELFARIHAAFNTLALRRSLREAQNALEQSVSIDAESGAFSPGELQGRLLSEIRRAQRYGRLLSIITLGVCVRDAKPESCVPTADVLRGVVQTADSAVRAHVDWIGRIETSVGAAFAIVLPEAGITEAPAVKDRLIEALNQYASSSRPLPISFNFGVATIERGAEDATPIEVQDMLKVAELCRMCPGRTGAEQLTAVQRSVASHVGIACRHGYFVDSECSLKGVPAARSAVESPATVPEEP